MQNKVFRERVVTTTYSHVRSPLPTLVEGTQAIFRRRQKWQAKDCTARVVRRCFGVRRPTASRLGPAVESGSGGKLLVLAVDRRLGPGASTPCSAWAPADDAVSGMEGESGRTEGRLMLLTSSRVC